MMQARPPYHPGVAADDISLILASVPATVWEALRSQRIFITGGTGFLGCWLLEALLAGNERFDLALELTVLTRQPRRFRDKAPHLAGHGALRLLEGDVCDLSAVDGRFDVIIHAATDVVNPRRDPLKLYHEIVTGAEQTLALAARSQAGRYLLTSSGAVYGPQPSDCPYMPESYPGAPHTTEFNSAYGQGKRVAEWLLTCHARQHKFEARIARCFAFVGPYMALDRQFAIGNFIRDSLAGATVQVGGDGTPYRSYLYAADLAVWLLTILVHGDSEPYNVGSSKRIAVGDLAKHVSATLTGSERVAIARPAVPGQLPQQYVPATDRANTLGLLEYTDLTAAIRKTAAWHPSPPGEKNLEQAPAIHEHLVLPLPHCS